MPTLTPTQAARQAGVSRRTLMRAIAKGELAAKRTNDGWQIEETDLEGWAGAHAHAHALALPVPTPVPSQVHEMQARISALEIELAGHRELVEAERRHNQSLETDRDHWRAMAQRSWWRRLVG